MNVKTFFKVLQVFLFSTLLIFFTVDAFSQTRKVAGKVVDETGNGIANVTVTVKGSRVATQTDATGSYSLEDKTTKNLALIIQAKLGLGLL